MNANKLQLVTGDVELAAKLRERYNSFEPLVFLGGAYMVESCAINLLGSGSITEFGMVQCLGVATEWNGEGLPPAGLAVEFSLNRGKVDWAAGVVIGQDGPCQVVIKYGSEYHARNIHGVRPIKTAEQIAAEERAKCIDAAYKHVEDWSNISSVKSIIGNLYDAGLIKQEAIQ